LESILETAPSFDFAVLVLAADDKTISRGRRENTPRDNVLFELGLFMGVLGKERAFMVVASNDKVKLPSDLAGVQQVRYHRHALTDPVSARAELGPAIQQLKDAIGAIGARVDGRE
jgi:predicted nucleotide-binding protein